jgi:hypothetical protein
MDIQFLARRLESRRNQRSGVMATIDDIDQYIQPLKDRSTRPTDTDENLENPDVWDFTAMDGANRLGASVAGSSVSSAFKWLKLRFPTKALREDHDAKMYLEAVENEVLQAYEDSDFYTEIGAWIQELVDHGTAFIAQEAIYAGPSSDQANYVGLDFEAHGVRDCLYDPDRKGGAKLWFRLYNWTTSQIIDKCEESGWPVPEDIREKDEAHSNALFEIAFCVFERPEILAKQRRRRNKVQYPAAPKNRPYGSVWFRTDNKEALGPEGGYFERPEVVTLWDKKAGSIWGYSPSHIALPTVKYLNARMETSRGAGEKAVDPPMGATHRGVLSDMDLRPGGLTIAQSKEDIWELTGKPARLDVANNQEADMRKQIQQVYHVDDLQLRESPAMTATEAQIRYELMNRVLGATLTRIQGGLSQIVRGTVAILFRAGRLPEMPASVKRAGGIYAIQYLGPLARSQRTDDVAAIERGVAQAAGLANNGFPEAKAFFNTYRTLLAVADRLGIPEDCINSKVEFDKAVKQMEQMAMQAAKADSDRKEAAAAKDMAAARANAPSPISFPGTVPMALNGQPA